MSVANTTSKAKRATYQPFECYICKSRFTRQENLKRHAAVHSRSPHETSLPCSLCSATFSRRDLRQRHMKRKHAEIEELETSEALSSESVSSRPLNHGQGRMYALSDDSRNTTSGNLDHVDGQTALSSWSSNSHYSHESQPASLGLSGNLQAKDIAYDQEDFGRSLQPIPTTSATNNSDSQVMSLIESPLTSAATFYSPNDPSPNLLQHRDGWFPSNVQLERGVELYFHYISHFVPFLHRPTFDGSNTSPHLALSMLSLGYQHGEDPACDNEGGSGANLALRCFHRARALLAVEEEQIEDEVYVLSEVQAYILLEICSMMYLCGKKSTYALRMHPKMIGLMRTGGLMQQRKCTSTTTEDLDSLWYDFVVNESRKRTVYAAHQLDAIYYQFLSMPRSLSHLEIKHDLPCPAETWSAPSAAAWAHRQLTSGQVNKLPAYVDAVRQFLSPTLDLTTLPTIDPYGAINIAQFLISSAREISGWSVMTGRVSMERFETLRSSLEALGPFIRNLTGSTTTNSSALGASSEATWETAMIELQMWSPSHTAGSVDNSIDAVLKHWTSASRGPWSEALFNASKAIQPHVDWYLQYLDEMVDVQLEPPWIALYSYKAFLIAWELLRGKVEGAMSIVGLEDGDLGRVMEWARKVFGRRTRWQIGRLIWRELDVLARAGA